MPLNILYSNIQSYPPKQLQIKHFIETNDISLVMLVETKTRSDFNIRYRDWTTIQLNGNQITNYARGGSAIIAHPPLQTKKQNSPKLINPLNECLHCTIKIPNRNEPVHLFLVYIHPFSKIEENILIKASLYKDVIIIGDFNQNTLHKH